MTPADRETPPPQSPGEDIEISVPLDTVCFIVAKLHERRAKQGSTDPSASRLDDDDIEAAVLEDRPSDPVEQELTSILSDLPFEQQVDIVTLMWFGRDGGDWADLRRTAVTEHTDETPGYICGTPLAADYLVAGLDALGLDCKEFLRGHG
ncbi:DUF3775 domain-containing protein [Rhodosalinus sp. FB01]|uniref:DUF3775 domain-containing protein n=1 Tax=Rhodosalinus sp. FB01 TaxID=3239194 RepID=UPI0035269313